MHRQKHRGGIDVSIEIWIKLPAFARCHIFAPVKVTERYMKPAVSRFHEIKKVYPIMSPQICLETLSTEIHLKMEQKNLSLDFDASLHVDDGRSFSSAFKLFSWA